LPFPLFFFAPNFPLSVDLFFSFFFQGPSLPLSVRLLGEDLPVASLDPPVTPALPVMFMLVTIGLLPPVVSFLPSLFSPAARFPARRPPPNQVPYRRLKRADACDAVSFPPSLPPSLFFSTQPEATFSGREGSSSLESSPLPFPKLPHRQISPYGETSAPPFCSSAFFPPSRMCPAASLPPFVPRFQCCRSSSRPGQSYSLALRCFPERPENRSHPSGDLGGILSFLSSPFSLSSTLPLLTLLLAFFEAQTLQKVFPTSCAANKA